MIAKLTRIDPLTVVLAVVMVLMLPMLYTELTGDFPGSQWFYGMEEDSWLSVNTLNAHDAVIAIFVTGGGVVMDTLTALKSFFA